MAAMALASGAIQIAAIRAQPLPALATGGSVGETGAAVVHQGEIILNKKQSDALRSNRGGSGQPIQIHNSIILDKKKLGEQVIEIVEDASARRGIHIRAWAVH